MTGAGICGGDNILFQKAEAPEDGAIMLVMYKNQKTVKRVRIKSGRVFLCWEDGSHKEMEADSDDYEVQGKFVQVMRNPKAKKYAIV
jgi:SOS-response transcriptional repressor LexA